MLRWHVVHCFLGSKLHLNETEEIACKKNSGCSLKYKTVSLQRLNTSSNENVFHSWKDGVTDLLQFPRNHIMTA